MAIKALMIKFLFLFSMGAFGQQMCEIYRKIPLDSLSKNFKHVFVLDTFMIFDRDYSLSGIQTGDDTSTIRNIILKGRTISPNPCQFYDCFLNKRAKVISELEFNKFIPKYGLTYSERKVMDRYTKLTNELIKVISDNKKVRELSIRLRNIEKEKLFEEAERKFNYCRKQMVVLYNLFAWEDYTLLIYQIVDSGNSAITYCKVFKGFFHYTHQ